MRWPLRRFLHGRSKRKVNGYLASDSRFPPATTMEEELSGILACQGGSSR